jgi:hypothetical protein
MMPSLQFRIVIAFTLLTGIPARPREMQGPRSQHPVYSGSSFAGNSASSASETQSSVSRFGATRYSTILNGDHSLEAAKIVEEVFSQYTLYTVRFQFASGVEQSIAIAALPGGLQPEVLDMSGDSVANDVVLNSSLLHAPLVVLLNDGHDHLTVAISPGSFSSREGRRLGTPPFHRSMGLPSFSSRVKAIASRGMFLPVRPQEARVSHIAHVVAQTVGRTSSFDRAPPANQAQI